VAGGYSFLGRGEEINVEKLKKKAVSFDPFLDMQNRKTLNNRSNDPFGPFPSYFYFNFPSFCLFRDFCPFSDIFGDFKKNFFKASD
jgi:hypothetical protein